MKIIYTTDLYRPKDFGGNRQAWETTAALARRGHGVRVITGAIGPQAAPEGVEVIRYSVSRRTPLHTFVSNAIGAMRCLRIETRRLAPDVILFQSIDAALIPLAIGFVRSYATAFIYVARFESAAMDRLAEDLSTKSALFRPLRNAPSMFARSVERFVLRRVHAIYAVSETAVQDVQTALRSHVPPAYAVPAGIDTNLFRPGDRRLARRALAIAQDAAIVLVVGRLVRVKRYDRALRAIAELLRNTDRPYLLLIVGEGPESAALRSLVSALGIDRHVRFDGYRDEAELRQRYWAADVQLCTSETETLGLSLIEGLASGVPVLSVPNGAADWLREIDPRLVLSNPSPGAIANGIHSLLHDPRLAELREQSREHVIKTYDWTVAIDRLESRLEELAHAAGP